MSQVTTANGQMDPGHVLWRGFAFLGLFCLLLALAGHPLPAAAASAWFVSTSGNDANDCSMLSPCRTIGVALGKAVDGDTIHAAAGLYNEHLVIDRSVRIVGANTNTTFIDGMSNGRAVQVTANVSVTLSALTIQNGRTTGVLDSGAGVWNSHISSRLTLDAVKVISNVVFAATDTSDAGGILNQGILTATNSTISGNWAARGGGIFNAGSATLVMSNTVLSSNSAQYVGGLINYGNANLSDVTIRTNTAVTSTGGIENWDVLTAINTTISGNSAPLGAGIFNLGTVTLTNTTISGNQTRDVSGGGIYNNNGATLTLNNVTFSGNSAPYGGALYNSGILYIKNTILANSSSEGNCDIGENPGSAATSLGYNLSSDSSCASFLNQTGDLNNKDPRLTALTNLGGSTAVHGLIVASPAIDAGNPAAPGSGGNACAATDQRGIARPVGTRCDIGAFEGATPAVLLLPLIRK